MKNYYIFKSGRLSREANSIMFEFTEKEAKKRMPIPINDIDSIYLFGEIDLNTKVINFLSQNNVMIHFFNYYGYYTGSFYPKEFLNSGDLTVKQSKYYLSKDKRLYLAKEFVKGAAYGSIQNLKNYKDKTGEHIEKIEKYYKSIDEITDKKKGIQQLMGIEGNIKETYYNGFQYMIKQEIDFSKRVKNPPDNMINALISFVNALIYTEVLKNIYKTQLNPTISYLHEPSVRRYSLSLDIAEIFKPAYGDRLIFSLLNNNELTKSHFDKSLNFAYLKEDGRKIVLKQFEDKLKTTIHHKQLNKDVSYKKIIKLECYKLIKHILKEEDYNCFKIWW